MLYFMDIGQNFRFGFYTASPADRMAAIKAAGFNSTMLWWGEEFVSSDGTKESLLALAKRNGLAVKTVHFPSTNAHQLWLDGEEGELYTHQLLQAVRDCSFYEIPNLVMHLTRKLITVPPNQTGIDRLALVCVEAEKLHVSLALENTRFLAYNRYVYEHLDSPALKFCFDTGHANCYTPDEDPLGLFGSRLATTHIHDNYGPAGHPDGLTAPSGATDLHNLIGDGNIDFTAVGRRLHALHNTVWNLESYCFAHSKYYGLSMQDYLNLSYSKLVALIKSSKEVNV